MTAGMRVANMRLRSDLWREVMMACIGVWLWFGVNTRLSASMGVV